MTSLSSYSPADGSVVWEGEHTPPAEIDAAVERSRAVALRWARTPFENRADVIGRFAESVNGRKEELATLIATEVGKALWDARTEVAAVVGKATLSERAAAERTGVSTSQTQSGAMTVRHRPVGVMAVLGPFNFPAHLPNGHIMPALLAGNTVVFKPSEQAPAVGAWMLERWRESGIPDNVVQIVHGAADTARCLVDHPDVDGVLFTGGVPAGRAIHAALAGRPEVLLALELGGNNPVIAWDLEAEPVREAAARIAARSAFVTAGQRCTCARRLIVPAGADGDAVIDHLMTVTAGLRIDHPLADPQPFHGPVISPAAADAVIDAAARLVEAGATPLVNPRIDSDLGPAFVRPGLLDVTPVGRLADEEVFGPLLLVQRADDIDHAVELANNTQFGLAAALLSPSTERWEFVGPRLDAGIVNWNLPTVGASGAAPFGGIGLSGNHRPAGYHAADYCADAVASLTTASLTDSSILQGVDDGV